mmetsp:Transcript_31273/g.95630  ORF Transcript_31273/g.95630 Transcript_31273/m.95630 type:complete len:225 (-) Transcript_31273:1560-2234(-)
MKSGAAAAHAETAPVSAPATATTTGETGTMTGERGTTTGMTGVGEATRVIATNAAVMMTVAVALSAETSAAARTAAARVMQTIRRSVNGLGGDVGGMIRAPTRRMPHYSCSNKPPSQTCTRCPPRRSRDPRSSVSSTLETSRRLQRSPCSRNFSHTWFPPAKVSTLCLGPQFLTRRWLVEGSLRSSSFVTNSLPKQPCCSTASIWLDGSSKLGTPTATCLLPNL